jgi:hypothetical protein
MTCSIARTIVPSQRASARLRHDHHTKTIGGSRLSVLKDAFETPATVVAHRIRAAHSYRDSTLNDPGVSAAGWHATGNDG